MISQLYCTFRKKSKQLCLWSIFPSKNGNFFSFSESCSVVSDSFHGSSHGSMDPMDSTVHEILQARILEWVVVPFSRGSSRPRSWTGVSCIAGGFFTSWATREALFQLYWDIMDIKHCVNLRCTSFDRCVYCKMIVLTYSSVTALGFLVLVKIFSFLHCTCSLLDFHTRFYEIILRYNWHITLRCTMYWFDTFTYSNMILQ